MAYKSKKKKNWHNPGAYADMIRNKSRSGAKGSAPIGGGAAMGGAGG